ncbi:MAG: flagellar hook-basal body complex protein FliE, partial [Alphaproteobacteria bacterium]|nr:flagellar hook-basal body complex protein FliE [Alphaproteobacteria bacterium]
MSVLPAAAAAAYQSVAGLGSGAAAASSTAASGTGGFGDFLNQALKDSVDTMKAGEQMATAQAAGQANIVDVVNA